jgi:hypothetical protein
MHEGGRLTRLGRDASLCAIVLTILFAGARGAAVPQRSEAGTGFTVNVPRGWAEIPRDVIEAQSGRLDEIAPGAPGEKIDYAYQMSPSAAWFTPPYVVVQVSRAGKISEDVLSRLAPLKGALGPGIAGPGLSAASAMKPGQTLSDPGGPTLWTLKEVQLAGGGPAKCLLGMRLTEEGGISIACYAKADDFEGYSATFEKIIRGVSVEPRLAYKPRSRAFYARQKMTSLLKGAAGPVLVVGVLIVVLVATRRLRRSGKRPTGPGSAAPSSPADDAR